jgi:N-acetylneuraminate synthase/sialic acid synthase
MIRDLDRLHLAMGDGQKRQFVSERDPLQKMGKKMVFVRSMPGGAVLTPEDISFKSPGDGMAPWMIDQVVGKRLIREMKAEDAVDIADLQ